MASSWGILRAKILGGNSLKGVGKTIKRSVSEGWLVTWSSHWHSGNTREAPELSRADHQSPWARVWHFIPVMPGLLDRLFKNNPPGNQNELLSSCNGLISAEMLPAGCCGCALPPSAGCFRNCSPVSSSLQLGRPQGPQKLRPRPLIPVT